MGGRIGDAAAADNFVPAANRDMRGVAEDGDHDVQALSTVIRRLEAGPPLRERLRDLQCPALRSRPFCLALAGLSGQISAADLPALIAAVSPLVLRWRGAASVASPIWPDIAR